MNKSQIVDAIAQKTGMTKVDARKGLDAFLETIASSLKDGEKTTLVGFGTFTLEKKNARPGRNPRNGAPIRIPARKVVKFRPATELSEQVK